ncbi:hypothetical protein MTO96_048432 [Rhipicephalus appendiculatus]
MWEAQEGPPPRWRGLQERSGRRKAHVQGTRREAQEIPADAPRTLPQRVCQGEGPAPRWTMTTTGTRTPQPRRAPRRPRGSEEHRDPRGPQSTGVSRHCEVTDDCFSFPLLL